MERRSLLPLLREFLVATAWFGANVGINLGVGFGWSFIWTGIAGLFIGYWRGDKGTLAPFSLWLLLNFWFFIYILPAIQENQMIGWFLLASYGSSLTGLILSKQKNRLSTGIIMGIMCLLGIALVLTGLQLPLTPPADWAG
ncbi:MAG: hypothetical protein AAFO96_25905 [Bacteroidota bacterium]